MDESFDDVVRAVDDFNFFEIGLVEIIGGFVGRKADFVDFGFF